MTQLPATALPHVEVVHATPEQAPILANLIELYAHDFSEFHNVEIGEDGRFGYQSLPLYWSDPSRHPFLVRLDGSLAGFVLVKQSAAVSGDGAVWDMAEFFILRGCRRQGIGTRVAHQVWRRFPGLWEVRVMEANVSAGKFWAEAIALFTSEATSPLESSKVVMSGTCSGLNPSASHKGSLLHQFGEAPLHFCHGDLFPL